jgi:hypothetical protein
MRLSKRNYRKYEYRFICNKWKKIFKEVDIYQKIARIQKKYYALLPYRPIKEPDLYKTIDIRLTEGVFFD